MERNDVILSTFSAPEIALETSGREVLRSLRHPSGGEGPADSDKSESDSESESVSASEPDSDSDSGSESESESERCHDQESFFQRNEQKLRMSYVRWRYLSERRLSEILDAIERIDAMLLWIDHLLYLLQPPASGRIRIILERYPSDEREESRYSPVFVKWIRGRGNRWRYQRLKNAGRAVGTKGGFATHREEVMRLIHLGGILMRDRGVLVGYLVMFSRGWTQKRRVLSGKEAEVLEALLDVVDRVNAKGEISLKPEEIFV